MKNRAYSLNNISSGDIFHAEAESGGSLICLALSVTGTSIHARTITTQMSFEFDRLTGVAEWGGAGIRCTIDSVALLPPEIRQTLLDMDRKFRVERDPYKLRLTEAEKQALVFVASHYPAHPL